VDVQPTLSDGVIVLDAFTLDDVETHLAGEDEEQARRFGWYPARSTPEGVRAAIIRWQEGWRTGGPTRAFAMRDASTGELVGGCEARLKGDGLAHLSYWVFPRFRRRGFASRGTHLLCDYVFTTLGMKRVELHIEEGNAASRGVARRAGFTEAGLVREEVGELGRFAPRPSMLRYVRVAPPTDLGTRPSQSNTDLA
jgi:RimJ/RimL family protein N-acetyltransferase